MKRRSSIFKTGVVVLAVLAVCLAWAAIYPIPARSCTNISISGDSTALFANNEDTHFSNLLIGVFPASSARYGSVHVGFRHPDGLTEFGGAMNDQGLAWDVNTAPKKPLNPHPERPFSHAEDNYLSTITRQAATVEEAIVIANNFDFGDSLNLQFHIADASGDAVVISAGADGELAFTRKNSKDDYLLLTNFNHADHKPREVKWRYQTAQSMLEDSLPLQDLTQEDVAPILDAVHLESLTSYTLYSNIFDLQNKDVYLYYMSQYDEVAVLNLPEELAEGQRVIDMREFFSLETTAAGDAAYRRFELRFRMLKIVVICASLVLIAGGILLMARAIRKYS